MPNSGKSKTIGVTPDPDLLAWVSRRTGPGERWSGPTHFFNWAARRAREEEQELADAIRQRRLDLLLDLLARQPPQEPAAGKPRRRQD